MNGRPERYRIISKHFQMSFDDIAALTIEDQLGMIMALSEDPEPATKTFDTMDEYERWKDGR